MRMTSVRLEALRTLSTHPDAGRFELLIEVAKDDKQPVENRATAIAGLSRGTKGNDGFAFEIRGGSATGTGR